MQESENEVTHLCPTLSNPMDCRLLGFSFNGIFQARVLEWVDITFSNLLLELDETHVHRVSNAIQPSHSLSSPSLLPSIFPSIRVFSNKLVLCIKWPKFWSLSQTRLSNFTCTFHFHALEKETATHSNVLAWRIPGTGEPGGLPSMGSHRVCNVQLSS